MLILDTIIRSGVAMADMSASYIGGTSPGAFQYVCPHTPKKGESSYANPLPTTPFTERAPAVGAKKAYTRERDVSQLFKSRATRVLDMTALEQQQPKDVEYACYEEGVIKDFIINEEQFLGTLSIEFSTPEEAVGIINRVMTIFKNNRPRGDDSPPPLSIYESRRTPSPRLGKDEFMVRRFTLILTSRNSEMLFFPKATQVEQLLAEFNGRKYPVQLNVEKR